MAEYEILQSKDLEAQIASKRLSMLFDIVGQGVLLNSNLDTESRQKLEDAADKALDKIVEIAETI